MAVADAKYRFLLTDIGAPGRISDGGVLQRSGFPAHLAKTFPSEQQKLPGTNIDVNHYIVGDPAFPISSNLMRPFSGRNLPYTQRIFNYRLCRARRVVENTFGIAAARWRIWRKPMEMQTEMAIAVCKAVVVLHNFAMAEESTYNPPFFADSIANGTVKPGQWRQDPEKNELFEQLPKRNDKKYQKDWPSRMRSTLAYYFIGKGSVPWQHSMVTAPAAHN